jgi:diacylglycerol kinase
MFTYQQEYFSATCGQIQIIMEGSRKNDSDMKFSMIARLKSFKSAFAGMGALLKSEHNARIHLIILIMVIVAGIILRISSLEWIVILFASGLVFVSECFNTAVEYLSNVISPEYNAKIKTAKDIAAAGVLISAVISIIIGIIVFLPKIWMLLAR